MEQLEAEPVVSEPDIKIHQTDLEGIVKAHLPVALTVDPYCLFVRSAVEKCERHPIEANHRVEKSYFVWMVFTAATDPRPTIGAQGDLWIDNTPGAGKVYFRGRSDQWVPWNNRHDHDASHSDHEGEEIAHPWLPNRCLQFTGFDIGWCAHRLLDVHRRRWHDTCGPRAGPGSYYDKLSVQYIINLRETYNRSSMSRRIIEPASFHPTRLRMSRSRISRMRPRTTMTRDPSTSSPGTAPSDASSAVAFPADIACRESTGTSDRGSDEAVVSQPPADMQEKPPKRGISPLFDLLEHEHAHKRMKGGEPEEGKGQDPDALASTSSTRPVAEDEGRKLEVAQKSVNAFLGSLPLTLSHRLDMLVALGITSHVHLEALALLPRQLQEELYKEVQGRGLPLIEVLVLRSGLNALRNTTPSRAQPTTISVQTDTMEKFLAQMHPSFAHRLHAFQELGIDATHLPVLASLDADTYAVFEGELRMKMFTWVELLLLKSSIRGPA
ncbi:hypothetical protein OH77DRAFT_1425689 [Trametes cingulata]|nr:hypothetical protein OH77DRAFT_1425689 [Trametes cingulata]